MNQESPQSAPGWLSRGKRFIIARFDPRSHLGLGLTTSLIISALAIWVLSGLLDAVLDNAFLVRLDSRAAEWFHLHATPTGLRIFDVITQLGSPVVDVLIVIVAIVLWRRKETLLLWTWLAANLGGKVVEYVLKTSVHRTRPTFGNLYLLFRHSYSFPSGHAMGASICYLMLAYLIASREQTKRSVAIAAFASAVALILLVAYSRLYLGVHYPSDVLGGMAAGVAWLAVCGATRRIIAGRRAMGA
ncbi:MAG TPA: phosphatase PAP2 family protein [Gemmatimonadaceae bacterium]|nr:phosphatase PAP2 family protein [Gemmatimonadaceae bacterium]